MLPLNFLECPLVNGIFMDGERRCSSQGPVLLSRGGSGQVMLCGCQGEEESRSPSQAKEAYYCQPCRELQHLAEAILQMANQLKALQDQQSRFETAAISWQEALRTPAHRQAFSAPTRPTADLKGFIKDWLRFRWRLSLRPVRILPGVDSNVAMSAILLSKEGFLPKGFVPP